MPMSSDSVLTSATPVPPGGTTQQDSAGKIGHSGSGQQRVAVPTPSQPLASIGSIASSATEDKQELVKQLKGSTAVVREAIEALNRALENSTTRAHISHDDELNRYIVKIQDDKSGEIIREIPNEALLRFARNLREMKGLLFDKAL